MRIHMPHVHLEDRQVKSFGRSLAALAVVGLMMAVFVAVFMHEAPIPQPDWLR